MQKPYSTLAFKVPRTTIQLLTDTSKMPSYSWSLPAPRACPRAFIAHPRAICKFCYARKGRYIMKNVRLAMEARFQWTRQCLKTETGRQEWIQVMVAAITDATKLEPVFRVHDSGDLFSEAYILMWIEVCMRLGRVKFWFPFRGWQQPQRAGAFQIMGQDDPVMRAVLRLASLANVTVRPSALIFGEPAPRVAGLAAGSTAGGSTDRLSGYHCPAPQQGGECGKCRHCWYATAEPVIYHQH